MAKGCCCCLTLKGGVNLVAIYTIVLSILMILSCMMFERNLSTALKTIQTQLQPSGTPPVQNQMLPGYENLNFQGNSQLINSALQTEGGGQPPAFMDIVLDKVSTVLDIVMGIAFAFYAFWIATALLLMVGARCKMPRLALPWLFVGIFLTGVLLLELVEFIIIIATKLLPLPVLPSMLSFSVFAALIAGNVYCCWCVWSYYLQERDEIRDMENEFKVPLTEVQAYTDEVPDEFTFKQKK